MTDVADPGRTSNEGAGSEPRNFPMANKWCPFSPPPEYAELRAESPISKVKLGSGREAWLLTRHEHVRQILGESNVSSNMKNPGYPLQMAIPDEILEHLNLPFVAMDPPEHTVRRRMLIPEFTVKRMQALRPRIQEIVDECVTKMLEKGGPLDLVQELAVPVPSLLFCEMLGVPAADTAFFRRYAEMGMSREASEEELGAAHQEMEAYLGKLVAEKSGNPGDDLLSRITAKNNEEGQLAESDMVSLARMLLFGGFDTTANMISLGTVAMLENPEQLAEIREDPSLTSKAIDEMLRYLSISDSATVRVATDDIEIGDVVIRKGEGVIALNGSANRDEALFVDSDKFDIHRDTRGHLAFGHGIHQCMGMSLAKLELEIVFNTLFARIPGLQLVSPVEDLSFKDDALIYGLSELQITW